MKIHPLADVLSEDIGDLTTVWQFAVILKGAKIGNNCNINCHTFIENNVRIGNNVTVKSGVYLWDGIEVEDNVFIGPNVSFTNDKYPRSKKYPHSFQKIKLEQGCSIGAGAIILGGITIGKYSMIAAGSLITKNVAPFTLMKGSPAKITAFINKEGEKLVELKNGIFEDKQGLKYHLNKGEIEKL